MSIEILEDNATINKRIIEALVSLISANYKKFELSFLDYVRPEIEKYIRESETYQSLIDGQLQGDFGIASSEEVESIVQELINVQIQLKREGLVIYYDSPSFFDVISLVQQSGSAVPWLQWLLLDGDKIVIDGFSVTEDIPNQAESRSGKAIMVTGGDFRVDPKFSGTESDNWITRLLQDYLPEIKNISARGIQISLGGI